ncbi:MAG: hypothetical protein MRJ68_18315 [Nitrospira sp.]|nr:hypothetical protein [Nitrospira sp.]
MIQSKIVIPEGRGLSNEAVWSILKHEDEIRVAHEVAVLFAIVTQRHKPVPFSIDADLFNAQRHEAGHGDTNSGVTAKELIQVRCKVSIDIHHVFPFIM